MSGPLIVRAHLRTRTCDAVPETKRAARDWRHGRIILLPGIYCQHGSAAFVNVGTIAAASARRLWCAKAAQKANFPAFEWEHVDAQTRTLAGESRHIVALPPLGTISRCGDFKLEIPRYGVNAWSLSVRRARVKGFCRQGFSTRGLRRSPGWAGALEKEIQR